MSFLPPRLLEHRQHFCGRLIPSGQAAILGFTMPLWATLVAWALLGERPTLRLGLAEALGGVGVGLLLARSADAYTNAPLGFAHVLLAALGRALGTLLLQRRPIEAPALVHTGWQLLIAAVPITAAALYFGDGIAFMPSWPSIAVITLIALMPMALGNVVWFLHRKRAARQRGRAVDGDGAGGRNGLRGCRASGAAGANSAGCDGLLRCGFAADADET